MNLPRSFALILVLVCASAGFAQTPRIDPAGIDGALLLCGSYQVTPEMFEAFETGLDGGHFEAGF